MDVLIVCDTCKSVDYITLLSYVTPGCAFSFNVVLRCLIYIKRSAVFSISVGRVSDFRDG